MASFLYCCFNSYRSLSLEILVVLYRSKGRKRSIGKLVAIDIRDCKQEKMQRAKTKNDAKKLESDNFIGQLVK